MTDISKYIRTGFYDDFKGYDTLLISVDIDGLLELENAFIQLSQGLPCFDFSTLKLLDKHYHVDIKAYTDENNSGLKQIDKGNFEWRLTQNNWNHFRDLLTGLHRNGKGGHQFLDSEANYYAEEANYIDLDSLQVVVSLNEYPFNFWEEHFARCNS
jgi:hypothetical protein